MMDLSFFRFHTTTLFVARNFQRHQRGMNLFKFDEPTNKPSSLINCTISALHLAITNIVTLS
jgi:hypothetical protein